MPRRVGLIYDCDIKKENADRNLTCRRVVPTNEQNPIAVGIENLFSVETVDSLVKSSSKFFDITPKLEKQVRGEIVVQPEIIEANKNEKGNLCDWLCVNGTKEDFKGFDAVLDIIAEIAGVPRAENDAHSAHESHTPELQTVSAETLTDDISELDVKAESGGENGKEA